MADNYLALAQQAALTPEELANDGDPEENRRSLTAAINSTRDPKVRAVLQQEYDIRFNGATAAPAVANSMRDGFPELRGTDPAPIPSTGGNSAAAPAAGGLSSFLDSLGGTSPAGAAPGAGAPANLSSFLDGMDTAPTKGKPQTTVLDRVKDVGLALLQGAIQVPQGALGLIDAVTGGQVGKTLENSGGTVGFRPDEAVQALQGMKSPALQAANEAVQNAAKGAPGDDQGFMSQIGRAGLAAIQNPSVILDSVWQSIPSIMAGGAVSRGALWAALSNTEKVAIIALPKAEQAAAIAAASPRLAAVAGGIGEGVTTAGGQVEQIRTDPNNPSRDLSVTQSVLGLGSGAVTGIIGGLTGALAKRVGFEEANNLMAGVKADKVGMGKIAGLAGAVGTEGSQEFLQSAQEQMAQNLATGQPMMDGVATQATLGAAAGGVMGFGSHAPHLLDSSHGAVDNTVPPVATPPIAPAPVTPSAPVAALTPEADRAAADAAQSAILTGTDIDSVVAAAMASVPTLTIPDHGVDTTGATDRMGAHSAADQQTAIAQGRPAGYTDTVASDSSPINVLGSEQVGAPIDGQAFDVRVAAVKSELQSTRVRQQIRDELGPHALNDITYYLGAAQNPSLPGRTSDRFLHLAEGILDRAQVRPIPTESPSTPGNSVPGLNNNSPAAPARIGLDNTPTGVMTVDENGNVIPQTRSGAISLADRARAMQERAAAEQAAKDGLTSSTPRGRESDGSGVLVGDGTLTAPARREAQETRLLPGPAAASRETIDAAAHEAATSPQNSLPEPTDAQKEAGNYAVGHTTIAGLPISIENPQGSTRSGVAANGKPWSNTLQHHYGYIRGTIGGDGEHVDAFIKPGTTSDYSGPVFVVDQHHVEDGKRTNRFDEHKALIGFDTMEEAKAAYAANYHADWNGMRTISATPMQGFKDWLATGDTSKAFHAPTLAERAQEMKQAAPAPAVTSFTTSKGSTYTVDGNTTTRNKAARDDVGHEGDSGPKEKSERTIYVDGDASRLSAAGLTNPLGGEKGWRVAIKDGKATLLSWNAQANNWGASPSGRDIAFHDQPAVGRSPVELWKSASDLPAGYEGYRAMHAGNPITEVRTGEKATAPAGSERISATEQPQEKVAPPTPQPVTSAVGEPALASPVPTDDAAWWTRQPIAERQAVLQRAGWKVNRDGTPTLGMQTMLNQAWERMNASQQRRITEARGATTAPAPEAATSSRQAGLDAWGKDGADHKAQLRAVGYTDGDQQRVFASTDWKDLPEVVRRKLDAEARNPYTGPTMAEMEKVNGIPTTEKVQRAIDIVGRPEFERQVSEQWKEYKPTTEDQKAMHIEAVAGRIIALENRKADAPVKESEPATAPEAVQPGSSLTDHFRDQIKAGNMPKDNPALRRMVAAFDGREPSQQRMKVAQEVLEAAIVQTARGIVTQNRVKIRDTRSTFDALLKLYESQPNLNIRTSTSIDNQAYSTPAPLAFLASDLAGIRPQVTTLEPTAGTGMLTIGTTPALTTLNELDDTRAALLREQGFTVTQEDATNQLAPSKSQDRVITNPPFGPIKNMVGDSIKVKVDGYTLGQIDHLIAARALATMKDDGRATLIIGANKVAGGLSNNDLIFMNWLYSHYNVTSHFEVDGGLYSRQGASWPVRVISINGREASTRISPAEGTIQRANTWDDVYDQFEQGLATGRAGRGLQAAPSSTQAAGPDVTQPVRQPAGSKTPGPDGQRPQASTAGNANVPGQRAGAVGDSGVVPEQPVGERGGAERPSVATDRPDRVVGNDRGPGAGEPDANPRTARVAAPKTDNPLTPAENEFQAEYIPRSGRKDAGVLIPVNMQQPTQNALSALEDAVGDIDKYAAKELGYDDVDALHDALMGLQVDSVASAIYQMGREKGTIIADQTGIGKGRQAAAIIRWAVRNDRTPIFVTVKPSLFTDMYGDLHDIGTDDVNPFIMNSTEWISGPSGEKLFANKPTEHRKNLDGIMQSGNLPAGRNALFMTYSQINVDNAQRKAVTALAPKSIFILDESHNAGGDSATGDFIKSSLDLGRGVVYLSATFAKRPDNMPVYFKTDMGEAVADDETLMAAMESGGLPLQTVVSNNLVQAGQMFRRERSFDGVEIRTETDTGNRERHEAASDKATEALRGIVAADRLFHEIFFKEMQKQAQAEGGRALDGAGNQASNSVNHTEFSSVVHNFVRQMLLGLEADKSADLAIAALQQGQKPLIALENTMGSFLAEYAENNKLKPGDSLGTFDYRNVLGRALERTRYITVQKPNGDKVKQYIPLSRLDPITLHAYTQAQEVIDGLKLDIPVSPLDWMRDRLTKAGFSVAEITGRNLMVDYTDTKKPRLAQMDQTEQKDKVRTTRLFNSGKLDSIILNVAGSTGISLHASEKFTDQRQRKMIVAQAAQDINIFMQMLGRIHRTGQVALPSYTLLNADLPAVKRPTALLSKKMKSLNANTSSNTESATSVKALDLLNKYGDQVVNDYLVNNPAFAQQVGINGAEPNDKGEVESIDDVARKVTGRLALLPVAQQKEVYSDLESQYETLIDYLNKSNQNDLEPRTFDFDAKETKSSVLFEGLNPSTPFGQDAVYNEFSVKAQGNAMSPAQIRTAIAESLGTEKTGEAHVDTLIQKLADAAPAFLDKLNDSQRGAAVNVQRTATMFLRQHAIGSMQRIEINGEPYVAVVTNIRSTHKASGNPFAMSKIQVTVAVNGALRSITVPATRYVGVETSQVHRTNTVEQMFKEGPKDERQTAKIITGNLLAAYGELKGVKGTIISFTKADGTTEQGILLPKAFAVEKNTQGDYRLQSGEAALKFLSKSSDANISRFGIQTRDGVVRVTPNEDGGVTIAVPKSKARGGKFFLDPGIRAATGDFITKGDRMTAEVSRANSPAAIDAVMKKQALYALPSMSDEAKRLAGDVSGPNSMRSAFDPGRRAFVAGAAAAAVTPLANAGETTLGRAAGISPKVMAQKVTPAVEKILRGNGATNIDGATRLRDAMAEIVKNGPVEVRSVAQTLLELLPAKGVLLQVDDKSRVNAHGVVDLDPLPRLRLFTAEDRTGLSYDTLLHESLHVAVAARYRALSSAVIRSNDALLKIDPPKAAAALAQFKNVWQEFREHVGSVEKNFDKATALSIEEALHSPDEFFVRSLTDPTLQAWMATQEYKGKTLWERFKDWVKASFLTFMLTGDSKSGTLPSWLDAALAATGDLTKAMKGDAADFKTLRAANDYQSGTQKSTTGDQYKSRFDGVINAASNLADKLNEGPKIVGDTGRYTAAQIAAMRNVGFETTAPKIQDRIKGLFQDAGKKLAQGLVDQFAPVKDISKEAYGLLRLSKGASGAFETFLKGGALKLTDGVYDFDDSKKGGVIDRLLIPLQNEHHDFFKWVAANRAERLMKQGKENLFTIDDIQALKTLDEGVAPFDYTIQNGDNAGVVTRDRTLIYRDSLATFNDMQKNILDMAEQSGLIDGERRKMWENEFYVPFYRVEDDGSIGGADIKSGAVRQQAFKSLTGRTNKLNADLLDNTLMNWAHLLDAGAKNRAAQATIAAATEMGIATPLEGHEKGAVWHQVNGERQYTMVSDPYVMNAISALQYNGMRGPVVDAMGAIKRALTIGVTASPFFKIRNLIRDSIQVIGTSPISANAAGNIAQGWKLTDPKSDAYFRLMAGGGTIHFGTMLEGAEAKRVQQLVESGVDKASILDSDQKVRAFYKNMIQPAIHAYNALGERGEAINRASLYAQLVKQGINHADASLQARDLMDFSMQGTFASIRFLTQVVPFFNARIQGLYKLGRAAKEDPARMAAVIGGAALASISLLMIGSDDKDWKKREDWDRNNYWWFKMGGTAFRIPKPFEIGAIATLAERGFELAFDKEMTNVRFRDQVLSLLGDNLSMNPIPQLVKPMLDVYANTNSFTGRPIETMGMEKLQAKYRTTPNTSTAAELASQGLNAVTGLVGKETLSPVQIDSLVQGYFGWLGTFVVGAGDVVARMVVDKPAQPTPDYWKAATGGIVSDLRDAPSRYVSQMYTQAKAVEEAYGTYQSLRKEGRNDEASDIASSQHDNLMAHGAVEQAKRDIALMNARIRLIQGSDRSGDDKRDMIRGIRDRQDAIARRLEGVN